jgi:N-acetylneuraminic acid mutarotase
MRPSTRDSSDASAVVNIAGVLRANTFGLSVGGYNGGYLDTVETYNPATDYWTAKAPMLTRRDLLAAGVVSGRLYVVGGSNGKILNTVEAYNPATNAWTTCVATTCISRMPTARGYLAAGIIGRRLYAVGGADVNFQLSAAVEAFNPR